MVETIQSPGSCQPASVFRMTTKNTDFVRVTKLGGRRDVVDEGRELVWPAWMASQAALSPFYTLCDESNSPTTPHPVAGRVALRR